MSISGLKNTQRFGVKLLSPYKINGEEFQFIASSDSRDQLTVFVTFVGKYCMINLVKISSVLEIKLLSTPPPRDISLSKLA